MAAYLIVDIEIKDPARYAEYVKAVPPIIAKHGGKYLVRGGKMQTLEGTWNPKRVVVVEFESFEKAMAWWSSEEYQDLKALRQATTVTRFGIANE